MNKAIQRTVRKIEPLSLHQIEALFCPFSEYLESPNIILLGDPGSGKTYTFEAAAKAEGARFGKVRHFLAVGGDGYEG